MAERRRRRNGQRVSLQRSVKGKLHYKEVKNSIRTDPVFQLLRNPDGKQFEQYFSLGGRGENSLDLRVESLLRQSGLESPHVVSGSMTPRHRFLLGTYRCSSNLE